jgi:uncharacterized membrane protein
MGSLPEATPRGPEYRLFDSGTVGLAAFICSPLAGAILIAVNYSRLGKAGKAVLAVTLGLIATAPAILLKMNWNTSPGSLDRLEYDAFEILLLAVMWIHFEIRLFDPRQFVGAILCAAPRENGS